MIEKLTSLLSFAVSSSVTLKLITPVPVSFTEKREEVLFYFILVTILLLFLLLQLKQKRTHLEIIQDEKPYLVMLTLLLRWYSVSCQT